MDMFVLKNERIEAKVNLFGAELKSLKKDGVEYMWEGDAKFWGRTSPVLFPFVGSVKNKEYRTKGATYQMGQHGFARDMEFTLLSQSEKELWFVLESDEETKKKYPYDFCLKIGYILLDFGLEVVWQVENPGKEMLPFSIGGHPAFNCPIDVNTKQTDYLLRFDCDGPLVSTKIEGGLVVDKQQEYVLQNHYLPITEHLFDDDALVIEKNQAQEVALCKGDETAYLTVQMTAPLFGIWSPPKKNAPFVCIEPWYGRCDAQDFDGELADRTWGNTIEAGETWRQSYRILV